MGPTALSNNKKIGAGTGTGVLEEVGEGFGMAVFFRGEPIAP